MADANIRAVITAKDEASKVVKGFNNSLDEAEKGSRLFAVGLLAAGAGAAWTVKQFMDSEQATAQLNAVLKSTGGAAGITADQVLKLSEKMKIQTGVSDEAATQMQSMLLTFTNIGKDIFPEVAQATLDMATAMNGGAIPSAEELRNQSIQLGKALQDPDHGLGALKRVGVNVDELKQKFTEGMSVQEKQKLILQELQKEFGGSANAAGNTFAGSMNKLKEKMNDTAEAIGKSLVPSLEKLIDQIKPLVDKVTEFSEKNPALVANIVQLSLAFLALGSSVAVLKPVFEGISTAWTFMSGPIGILLAGIAAIAYAAYQLATNWQNLNGIMRGFFSAIGGPITGAIAMVQTFRDHWAEVSEFIRTSINNVKSYFQDLKDHFWLRVGEMIGFFATLPIRLGQITAEILVAIISRIASVNWGAVWNGVGSAFMGVANWIKNAFNDIYNHIRNIDWGAALRNIITGAARGLHDILQGAINGALRGLPGSPKINLPGFAAGVQNFAGGMAIVGERGPEIVQLPQGSNVIPNNQIGGVGGNINLSVNVGVYAGTEQEKRKVAKELFEALGDIASSKNMTVAELLA